MLDVNNTAKCVIGAETFGDIPRSKSSGPRIIPPQMPRRPLTMPAPKAHSVHFAMPSVVSILKVVPYKATSGWS